MEEKYVQVCGVTHHDGYTDPYVPDEKATAYGVYVGRPGQYEWKRDFRCKAFALFFAKVLAVVHRTEVVNNTYMEK